MDELDELVDWVDEALDEPDEEFVDDEFEDDLEFDDEFEDEELVEDDDEDRLVFIFLVGSRLCLS